jgi:predicted transcriptional regulator
MACCRSAKLSILRPATVLCRGYNHAPYRYPALGSLKLIVMEILWRAEQPLTIKDVHEALCERHLAYTTVMTVMARLWGKDSLSRTPARVHLKEGGRAAAYAYSPIVSKDAILVAAVDHLCMQIAADREDRAAALAVLLGAPR